MSALTYLKIFDKTQLFRFFVDGRLQSKYLGWRGYENKEPGSTRSMMNGFSLMIDRFDLSRGLSTRYLVDLHRACMFGVKTSNMKSSPGDLRYLNSGMPLFKKTTTLANIKELLLLRWRDDTVVFNTHGFEKIAPKLNADELYTFLKKEGRLNYRPWYPNLTLDMQNAIKGKVTLREFYEVKSYVQMKLAERMDCIVATFNTKIFDAKSSEEKLYLFSKIVRDLELLHPFPDGNCRTFAGVLLNHLLLFHGFPPAILSNPNLDGELSYKEFVEEIKTGIDNTCYLLENPEARLYNFAIRDSPLEDLEDFLEMAAEFFRKLDCYRELYLTLERIASILGGKWLKYRTGVRFYGVGSHTTVNPGYLYFCFAQEMTRAGKDVVAQIMAALEGGANAFVIDDPAYVDLIDRPVLVVEDCEQAMETIAAEVRREVKCQAVLVTGTVGKTGFKLQLNHCLGEQTKIHAFLNSINTRIPILRTLASLEEDDKVEIVEVSVGKNHEDAARRSHLISPNICVFTDIDQNHMNLHQTIDNLVRAKASTVNGLHADGVCLVNSEARLYEDLVASIREIRDDIEIATFGTNENDSARIISTSFDKQQYMWHVSADIEGVSVSYSIPLFHSHAPVQSLGVLLAVKRLGYDVAKAADAYAANFESFTSIGRLFEIELGKGKVLFYDQSYRGAIHAMRSAFRDIRNMEIDSRKVFVIGGSSVVIDNEFTKSQHAELADMINDSDVDRLYTTGKYMGYVHDRLKNRSALVKHSDDLKELVSLLRTDLRSGDFLFIMGSGDLYLGRLGEQVLRFGKSTRKR